MSSPGDYSGFRRFSDGGRPDNAIAGGAPQYGDDFYIYPAAIGNIAAGGQAQAAVIIQQDAAFEWIETTCSGFKHGVSAPVDNVVLPINVQVTDTGAGRALFFAPIPINAVAGSGKQPFILPVSKVFVPLSTITVSAQSTDPTDTYDNIYFNFIGRRVFEYGPGRR
jgi:hypothetical protein